MESSKDRLTRVASTVVKKGALDRAVGYETPIVSTKKTLKEAISEGIDFKAAGYDVFILERSHPRNVKDVGRWEVIGHPPNSPYGCRGTPFEDVLRGEKPERTDEWETFYSSRDVIPPYPEATR